MAAYGSVCNLCGWSLCCSRDVPLYFHWSLVRLIAPPRGEGVRKPIFLHRVDANVLRSFPEELGWLTTNRPGGEGPFTGAMTKRRQEVQAVLSCRSRSSGRAGFEVQRRLDDAVALFKVFLYVFIPWTCTTRKIVCLCSDFLPSVSQFRCLVAVVVPDYY